MLGAWALWVLGQVTTPASTDDPRAIADEAAFASTQAPSPAPSLPPRPDSPGTVDPFVVPKAVEPSAPRERGLWLIGGAAATTAVGVVLTGISVARDMDAVLIPGVLSNVGAMGFAAGAGILRGQHDAHTWMRTGKPDRDAQAFLGAGTALFSAGLATSAWLFAAALATPPARATKWRAYQISFQVAASTGAAGLGMLTYGLAYGRERTWQEHARLRGVSPAPTKPRRDGYGHVAGALVTGTLAASTGVLRYMVMVCHPRDECDKDLIMGTELGAFHGALNLATVGISAAAGVHRRRTRDHQRKGPSKPEARKMAIVGGALLGAGVTGQLLSWTLFYSVDPCTDPRSSCAKARLAGHVFGAQLAAFTTAAGAGLLGHGATPPTRHRRLALRPFLGPHLGGGITGRF